MRKHEESDSSDVCVVVRVPADRQVFRPTGLKCPTVWLTAEETDCSFFPHLCVSLPVSSVLPVSLPTSVYLSVFICVYLSPCYFMFMSCALTCAPCISLSVFSPVLPVSLSTCLLISCVQDRQVDYPECCSLLCRGSCCHGGTGETPIQVSTPGLDECDWWVDDWLADVFIPQLCLWSSALFAVCVFSCCWFIKNATAAAAGLSLRPLMHYGDDNKSNPLSVPRSCFIRFIYPETWTHNKLVKITRCVLTDYIN